MRPFAKILHLNYIFVSRNRMPNLNAFCKNVTKSAANAACFIVVEFSFRVQSYVVGAH